VWQSVRICLAHEQGGELAGELPAGVEVMVADRPAASDRVEFWVPPFLAHAPAVEELRALESLRVVQLLSAGIDRWLGRLPAQVTLCDARGVHTSATAEWAVTAILSYVRVSGSGVTTLYTITFSSFGARFIPLIVNIPLEIVLVMPTVSIPANEK
jgi:hypothetical protein